MSALMTIRLKTYLTRVPSKYNEVSLCTFSGSKAACVLFEYSIWSKKKGIHNIIMSEELGAIPTTCKTVPQIISMEYSGYQYSTDTCGVIKFSWYLVGNLKSKGG